MKHLKTYESSNNFYWESSGDEINSRLIDSNKLGWNDDEIFIIESMFKEYDGVFFEKDSYYLLVMFYKKSSEEYDRLPLRIYKCKDEWYYVSHSVYASSETPFSYRGNPKYKFYTCDQFDGLISYLEHFKNTDPVIQWFKDNI